MYYYVMIQRISYKDFTMDIMGVESLEETMADNWENQHDGYLKYSKRKFFTAMYRCDKVR